MRARQLLNRAVRRYTGQPVDPGEAAFDGEDLELDPGWPLAAVRGTAGPRQDTSPGDLDDAVAGLLRHGLRAGAVTTTIDGARISLAVDPRGRYTWHVTLGTGQPFALCSPAREDARTLGRDAVAAPGVPEGVRTALAIWRHGAAAASSIVAAHRAAFPAQAPPRPHSRPRPGDRPHDVTMHLRDPDRPLPATITATAASASQAIARAAVVFTLDRRLTRRDAGNLQVDQVTTADGQDAELA